ncbi:refilin-A [Chiloscyllium plagiosum]|uniref:refilin-A n=1 Tax=Chiloscyllium plagiosum TaxID=36176 RepID=UPI001CB7D1B8|nr:refilin-A [Chiloscyllium plagiosum]
MVGHLNLQDMNENFEMKCKNQERFLDSPDSGLPLSPSPPFFALSPRIPEDKGNPISLRNSPAPATRSQEGKLIPYISLNSLPLDPRHRMQPVCFGERIELNCESAQEIRCHSLVRYDSEKHYRDCIYYETVPTITFYTETIITTPNCTWRNYKSQLRFEPRQKPLRFESTTIIFPKRTKNIFRTTLNYNPRGSSRRFMSSVRLQTIEMVKPCFIYMENL